VLAQARERLIFQTSIAAVRTVLAADRSRRNRAHRWVTA
jgi:hypothetical protein